MVARDDEGRVLFVRHALPGELVEAVVTERHARFSRADAIDVIEASPDRVVPPCPSAGPGRCGGCDFQHAAPSAQRQLKGALLAAALRQAGIDEVPAVGPGRADGTVLGTRTRLRYAVAPDGRLAMRRHRSHELVEVGDCPLGVRRLTDLELAASRFEPGAEVLGVSLSERSEPLVASVGRGGLRVLGGGEQRRVVEGLDLRCSPTSFFQVHDAAPELLVGGVLSGLALDGGERVADLFCGVGLFTAPIARAVGRRGDVLGVDGSDAAIRDARANLASFPWAHAARRRLDVPIGSLLDGRTHVVVDPPRAGLPAALRRALGAAPQLARLVYVSCEPSTLSRDLAALHVDGFELERLSAHDLFEMTEHVECVAVLSRR